MVSPLAQIAAIAGQVPDPEIPVITLGDLGIVRTVEMRDGKPLLKLTPTYSGCPATEVIVQDVRRALEAAGHSDVAIQMQLAPAWTTDWISPDGREKLRAYGIAPPTGAASSGSLHGAQRLQTLSITRWQPAPDVACPRCASLETETISWHGSTPCKALYRCRTCREPFDYFKPH